MIIRVILEDNAWKSGKHKYIEKYGHHFNAELCWTAISKMNHTNKNPLSQEFIDTLLKLNSVSLCNNVMMDYVYVANMAYFDYYGSSIIDDQHLALFIKDYIDDEDGYEGKVFDRWIADAKHIPLELDWESVI